MIFLCIAILVQLIGCNSTNKVERGDLPYYNSINPIFTRAEDPTVENVYPYEDAAVIVSYIDGPRYYENNIALEAGSNEEAIFLKTGLNLTNSYYEYTVKILQVLDDKKHSLKSDETINIRCGIRNSGYDPFNIYIK